MQFLYQTFCSLWHSIDSFTSSSRPIIMLFMIMQSRFHIWSTKLFWYIRYLRRWMSASRSTCQSFNEHYFLIWMIYCWLPMSHAHLLFTWDFLLELVKICMYLLMYWVFHALLLQAVTVPREPDLETAQRAQRQRCIQCSSKIY